MGIKERIDSGLFTFLFLSLHGVVEALPWSKDGM